jgi:hypothetical protein
MAGPSKKTHVGDEMFYELLRENEYSGNSESEYSSDNEINEKFSVGGDEAESVSNNGSLQPDVQANSGAERPHFPFTGKPGINVDLEDPSNPLEYFEMICMPDILEVIARETNRQPQKFLETPLI